MCTKFILRLLKILLITQVHHCAYAQLTISSTHTSITTNFNDWFGNLPSGFSQTGNGATYIGTTASTTGGTYAIALSGFGWQASSSANSIVLTGQYLNKTGCIIQSLSIQYEAFEISNRTARNPGWTVSSNAGNFSSLNWSYNSISRADSPDLIISTITGLNIPNDSTFTISWASDRGAGTGSSPLIGLNNISIRANISTTPSAPNITQIQAKNESLAIHFSPPTCDGGHTINNYSFSTDDGITWTTPSTAITSAPLIIQNLVNGVQYAVKIRAINSQGSGSASQTVQKTPGIKLLDTVGGYEYFEQFNSFTTLPTGIVVSDPTYIGNWSSGVTTGLRGNAGILGYQHSNNSGNFEIVLQLENNTGDTVKRFCFAYTGFTARTNENRSPEWTVRINGEEISALNYSTSVLSAQRKCHCLEGLNIAPTQGLEVTWKSDRGFNSTTGASKQIGIGALYYGTKLPGLSLTTQDSSFNIDFDSSFSGINNGKFAGTGFSPTPAQGQLNSHSWSTSGWSDGRILFGKNGTSGDFAQGNSGGGVTASGIYAFYTSSQNSSLGVQPGTGDFIPGHLTLCSHNATHKSIDSINIAYSMFIRNDQNRSNQITLSYSLNNEDFTMVANSISTSEEQADTAIIWKKYQFAHQIKEISIPPNGFIYFRWTGNDYAGSGSRDEFALDDIQITCNPSNSKIPLNGHYYQLTSDALTSQTSDITIQNKLQLNTQQHLLNSYKLTIQSDSLICTNCQIDASSHGAQLILKSKIPHKLPALKHRKINALSLQGSGGAILIEPITIDSMLELNDGKIILQTNDLRFKDVIGGNDSSYICTNSNGRAISMVYTQEQAFPIGNSSYNPLKITNNTGVSDTFAIRVLDEVYSQGLTGSIVQDPRVKRTWDIEKRINKSANSGQGVDLEFSWLPQDTAGALQSPSLYHYDSPNWFVQTGNTTLTQNTLVYTGYMGNFSPFAIAEINSILPLTFHFFNVNYCTENDYHCLHWKIEDTSKLLETAKQLSIVRWENAGEYWKIIGNVSLRATSFTDIHPQRGQKNNYRLSLKNEGGISYSDIISIEAKDKAQWNIYPNPVSQGEKLNITNNFATQKSIPFLITDKLGRKIAEGLTDLNQITTELEIELPSLSPGIYTLHLQLTELHKKTQTLMVH